MKYSIAQEYNSAAMLIRYFVGIALQVLIVTIYVSLALSILGFDNALLIAFFAALMNVIPYIGPILGASFEILIQSYTRGDDFAIEQVVDYIATILERSLMNFGEKGV